MANITQMTIGNTTYNLKDTESNNLSKTNRASVIDLLDNYGYAGSTTIRLQGEKVPYRYQQGNRTYTQSSMRYTLPKNAKTVTISLHTIYHINSYTLLDENDNVIMHKYEEEEEDVTYTLYAIEARYLICSNNNEYVDGISALVEIEGATPYIEEAKRACDEKYTLLKGIPKSTYHDLFDLNDGNYSLEYNITGYDYIEITSMNVTTNNLNKYTLFDLSGNILGFYKCASGSEEVGQVTTIKVAVPANATKVEVATYRNARPNVLVYGIKMPESYGWTQCISSYADYVYQAYTYYQRNNGSKEFAASEFDIFRIVNGIAGQSNNAFTAFDINNEIVGYVQLSSSQVSNETYFICPKGTVKIAIAANRAGAGYNTSASISVEKRKVGKKISVMGDSISTYKNFIPTGNAVYYEDGNHDVPSASYTWWGIVAREKGYSISTINAWSGSRVSDTVPGSSVAAMCMNRTNALAENGTPDIIIIFGGVNDFLKDAPLGEWAGKAEIPVVGDNFRKAYAMMLNKIHTNYPLAKVYCCTIMNCERDLVIGNLEKHGDHWLHEFNDAIREIAPIMNCNVINLDTCGFNQYNMSAYMGDYNSSTGGGLHPNRFGHKLIADRVLEALDKQ